MVSLFRLRGRALQIDNTAVMTLTFFTGALLIFTVSLLPSVYEAVSPMVGAFKKEPLSGFIDLAFSVLFILLSLGFYSSVRLGVKRYLFRKAVRKKATSRDIFFYLSPKSFFPALWYSLRILSVKLLLFLFCFLPSAVCFFVVDRFSRQGVSVLVCLSLGITALCLLVNAGIFFSLFYSSFFLCDYYYTEGKYVSFRHLLSCSQKNMQGRSSLLTRLKLSFSGWLLLCVFIFPIPYVWGYYNQSLAVAAAEFMD